MSKQEAQRQSPYGNEGSQRLVLKGGRGWGTYAATVWSRKNAGRKPLVAICWKMLFTVPSSIVWRYCEQEAIDSKEASVIGQTIQKNRAHGVSRAKPLSLA